MRSGRGNVTPTPLRSGTSPVSAVSRIVMPLVRRQTSQPPWRATARSSSARAGPVHGESAPKGSASSRASAVSSFTLGA